MWLPWLLIAVILGSGCTAAATSVPAGGACVRSTQCVAGLACVPNGSPDGGGMCSSDVTGLLDGAALPPRDMMAGETAPAMDTGVPPIDMGPPVDMGPPPPVDMGPPPVDMGPPPPVDMGPPPVDLGPPDTGPPPVDAGTVD